MLLNLRRLALPEDQQTTPTLTALAFTPRSQGVGQQTTLLTGGSTTVNDSTLSDHLELKELGPSPDDEPQIAVLPTLVLPATA